MALLPTGMQGGSGSLAPPGSLTPSQIGSMGGLAPRGGLGTPGTGIGGSPSSGPSSSATPYSAPTTSVSNSYYTTPNAAGQYPVPPNNVATGGMGTGIQPWETMSSYTNNQGGPGANDWTMGKYDASGQWVQDTNPSDVAAYAKSRGLDPSQWANVTNPILFQNGKGGLAPTAASGGTPTSPTAYMGSGGTNPTATGMGSPYGSGSSSTTTPASLFSGVGTALSASSPTGGVVTQPSAQTSSFLPAAGQTAQTQTGVGNPQVSNLGGDQQGTIGTPGNVTPSANGAGGGVLPNTSPSSYLPTPATASQLGPQQAVSTPTSFNAGNTQGMFAQGTNWNVTPQQTVQGQYAQLMSGSNPAIQAAEQNVIRNSAAVGGGNDLMAKNAATMQGSQLALQIASQDAQTYAAAGQYNANVANQFATNLNSFIQNSQLSTQNFQQGLSMLSAQTNQQMQLMASQLNANAIQAGINIKSFAQQTQIGLQATLAQMNTQYGMTLGQMGYGAAIQSSQAWQQYGMNVRLNFLGNVAQQQSALMNTMAAIQTNPNITSAQAQSAMSSAINEFNTFLTQYSAYSASMMPSSTTGTSSGTYNSGSYNYSYINPTGWPSPSTGSSTGTSTSTGTAAVGTAGLPIVQEPSNLGVLPSGYTMGGKVSSGTSEGSPSGTSAGGPSLIPPGRRYSRY